MQSEKFLLMQKSTEIVRNTAKRRGFYGETYIGHIKNPVKRKNLPQSTRITVYNKTEGRCAICGDFVPYDDFTIDHIEPLSKGGDNEPENLQCTCRFCNFLKGNLPDQEFMDKVTDIVLVRAGKDKDYGRNYAKSLRNFHNFGKSYEENRNFSTKKQRLENFLSRTLLLWRIFFILIYG